MIYVFDSNSLSTILKHYYVERFPTFWEKFNETIKDGTVISVREVKHELELKFDDEEIQILLKHNSSFFRDPEVIELQFITQIYSVRHFQQNLERKKLLQGGYFADPFVISKAVNVQAIVVTEEELKVNGVKVPNICDHFHARHLNLEGFLKEVDWKF